MTKSSVDRKRSKYGEKYSLRFHKRLKTYDLTCKDETPHLIAKFVETDGDLAMRLFERLESNYKENEQLKIALKNSYMNEICENCKHGNYFLSDNYDGGFEGDFECLKKHFGNDHWECDGLTECDEFELEIKGDVE